MNVVFRVDDICEGEVFTASNVKSIRPGFGLAPKYYDFCLGKKAACDIKRGTALSFDLLEN